MYQLSSFDARGDGAPPSRPSATATTATSATANNGASKADHDLMPVATQVVDNAEDGHSDEVQQQLVRTAKEIQQLQEILEGAPEAKIVDVSATTPSTSEKDDADHQAEKNICCRRSTLILLGIFAVILIVVAAIVVAVIVSRDDQTTDNTYPSSSSPTSAPPPPPSGMLPPDTISPMPTISPQEQLLQLLLPISGIETLSDESTSQFQAMKWLLDDDPANLSPDDSQMIQRYILVVLYFATAATTIWINSFNFLTDKPVCDWNDFIDGVKCDFEGNVIDINLGENGLKGSIPSELGYLSRLERLFLYRNEISGTLPQELSRLEYLEVISFWICRTINGSIPTEYGNLSSLKRFSAGGNQLTGPIPSEFGQLVQLTSIELFNNALSGEFPSELGSLPNLENLDIYHNQITGNLNPIFCDSGGLHSMSVDCGASGLITCNCCHGCW